MPKNYSDLDSQADVMAGLTGDLRDLQGRVIELRDHIMTVLYRSQMPDQIEYAVHTTRQKLDLASMALAAALSVAEPLALTLLEAQKALEASESTQDAPQPQRGPWIQGDS